MSQSSRSSLGFLAFTFHVPTNTLQHSSSSSSSHVQQWQRCEHGSGTDKQTSERRRLWAEARASRAAHDWVPRHGGHARTLQQLVHCVFLREFLILCELLCTLLHLLLDPHLQQVRAQCTVNAGERRLSEPRAAGPSPCQSTEAGAAVSTVTIAASLASPAPPAPIHRPCCGRPLE